jgi:hypothetical protein
MRKTDNPVLRWMVYQFAWWIVRRKIRETRTTLKENRTKLIAVGVVALVLAGGAVAARAASDQRPFESP